MKPYGATTEDYGCTGCCPGHDGPMILKWSGMYGKRWKRSCKPRIVKIQNRKRRRADKRSLTTE